MKHTFTKAAVVAAIAAGALFAVPTAASAYTPPPTGQVSSSTVAPGGTFTLSVGSGAFGASESVSIQLTGENASGASLAFIKFAVETQSLGTVTSNADGSIGATAIRLPANASGTYTVLATSASNPVGVSATVTASATGTTPGGTDGGLAATGADSEALLTYWIAGGALVLAGGGVVAATAVRRNRKQAAAA